MGVGHFQLSMCYFPAPRTLFGFGKVRAQRQDLAFQQGGPKLGRVQHWQRLNKYRATNRPVVGEDMNTDTPVIEIATSVLLIVGMLVFIDLGYRIGRRRNASISVTLNEGMGTVDVAVFGVLGLTLAFTFGGASDRLAVRRAQIVQEANAIGTAYLRVDLLPASEQPALRALYREYLESRIEVFDKIRDRAASNAALDKGSRLQKEIWSRSVAACQVMSNPSVSTLVVSALNDMFDITTTRTMATVTHAPLIVLGLLVMLSFLG